MAAVASSSRWLVPRGGGPGGHFLRERRPPGVAVLQQPPRSAGVCAITPCSSKKVGGRSSSLAAAAPSAWCNAVHVASSAGRSRQRRRAPRRPRLSNAATTMSSLVANRRNSVRRETPTASASSSAVTASKPRSENRASACSCDLGAHRAARARRTRSRVTWHRTPFSPVAAALDTQRPARTLRVSCESREGDPESPRLRHHRRRRQRAPSSRTGWARTGYVVLLVERGGRGPTPCCTSRRAASSPSSRRSLTKTYMSKPCSGRGSRGPRRRGSVLRGIHRAQRHDVRARPAGGLRRPRAAR